MHEIQIFNQILEMKAEINCRPTISTIYAISLTITIHQFSVIYGQDVVIKVKNYAHETKVKPISLVGLKYYLSSRTENIQIQIHYAIDWNTLIINSKQLLIFLPSNFRLNIGEIFDTQNCWLSAAGTLYFAPMCSGAVFIWKSRSWHFNNLVIHRGQQQSTVYTMALTASEVSSL